MSRNGPVRRLSAHLGRTRLSSWHRRLQHRFEALEARIVLASAPIVDAGGPYAVVEGGMVTLAGTATDPDNDPLTYEWDLDGDGVFGESSTARGNEQGRRPPLTPRGSTVSKFRRRSRSRFE